MSITLASGMILAILLLAVPAIVGLFAPPPALITATPAAIPTAFIVAPVVTTPASTATPAPPAGPPAGALLLPVTIPAGATAADRMFTVYAGWPYRATGGRQGDSCELDIWPDGRATSEHLWVDCSPLGL
jgi:hypothetical protein